MSVYKLAVKIPPNVISGGHDSSAAIFKDGTLVAAVEEERFNRIKHGDNSFPKKSIEYCLNATDIRAEELDELILTYSPSGYDFNYLKMQLQTDNNSHSTIGKLYDFKNDIENTLKSRYFKKDINLRKFERYFGSIPEIKFKEHHYCHAASAFYPSPYENALILTIDGRGKKESTVVWKGCREGLEKIDSKNFPNSLGRFYATVTEFLGYQGNNGEGKVMGLAAYGSHNRDIERRFRKIIDVGHDYDVTEITEKGIESGVKKLEKMFNRERKQSTKSFSDWERDFAFTSQKILEDICRNLASHNIEKIESNNVCMAGGVALNCKMNKEIMELDSVENMFIQPVANDAGLVLGAGWSEQIPANTEEQKGVYYGPKYSKKEIKQVLDRFKLDYKKPENLERKIAQKIADGEIIGWFQGKTELGPRALGNRSILADPRSDESKDRVNEFVKNREKWRPFAPSILEEKRDEYLINSEEAPFMIKSFDVKENKKDEIIAVIHEGDSTTRPQTVSKEQNAKYYSLIKEFEKITGVPALLNTSFNDNQEPIVNTPKEAIRDFYSMGLDTLVIGDYILEK